MKFLIGLALSANVSVQAATVFETQVYDAQKKSSTLQQVWLSDNTARVNNDTQGKIYSLMQLGESDKSYFVDIEKKQIMDLSSPPAFPKMMQMPKKATELKAELKKHGKGPMIASFETDEYHVYANGKLCGSEYLSAKVLELKHVRTFLQTMKKRSDAQKKQEAQMPFISSNPCEKARQDLADDLIKKGAVLRSTDAKGQVQFEMSKISLDQTPSPAYFDLPKDFKVSTPQQMMQEMMQKAFKNQGKAPAAPTLAQ